jgi:hypothetical protein
VPREPTVEEVAADGQKSQTRADPLGDGWEVGAEQADCVRCAEATALIEQAEMNACERPANKYPSPASGWGNFEKRRVKQAQLEQSARTFAGLRGGSPTGARHNLDPGARAPSASPELAKEPVGRGAAVGRVCARLAHAGV